eukprot:INCI18807.1.p1 GENE.INCI18807.1~~INCI18807.1.p1  ORF type:complete len:164 (-),score=21.80 INCI18807.1:468-959(-)
MKRVVWLAVFAALVCGWINFASGAELLSGSGRAGRLLRPSSRSPSLRLEPPSTGKHPELTSRFQGQGSTVLSKSHSGSSEQATTEVHGKIAKCSCWQDMTKWPYGGIKAADPDNPACAPVATLCSMCMNGVYSAFWDSTQTSCNAFFGGVQKVRSADIRVTCA